MNWLRNGNTVILPLTLDPSGQGILSVKGGVRFTGNYEHTDDTVRNLQVLEKLDALKSMPYSEQEKIKTAFKSLASEFEGKVVVHEQEYGGSGISKDKIKKTYFTMLHFDVNTFLIIPEPGSVYPTALFNNYYICSCRLATREEIDEYQSITGI